MSFVQGMIPWNKGMQFVPKKVSREVHDHLCGQPHFYKISVCDRHERVRARRIWESYWRESVPDGWSVHHIDGNASNNEVSNLWAMPGVKHLQKHGHDSAMQRWRRK